MGMGGADLALLLGQLGSAGISAWGMPDGQELQTFEGEGELDPRNMMGEARTQINDMIGQTKARANRPVSVRSGYVQQPPVFTGGGLPMPIGVVGMDAALADKSLLSLPGLSGVNVDPIPRDQTFPPRNPQPTPPPDGDGNPTIPRDGTDDGESGPLQRASAGPARRAVPGQSLFSPQAMATGMGDGSGDDLSQGVGAMEVYLRTLAGRM